ILGIETAFEQQQASLGCLFAHHARLLDAAYGETVGLLAQRRRHRCRTVAVGIGLDHRERPASRCATLGQGLVVTNGGQVDRGNEGTHRAGSCAVWGSRYLTPVRDRRPGFSPRPRETRAPPSKRLSFILRLHGGGTCRYIKSAAQCAIACWAATSARWTGSSWAPPPRKCRHWAIVPWARTSR